MENNYLYDTNPHKSAYLVPVKSMFKTMQSLCEDISNGQNKFVENNKCWIYAFNFALIRRFEIEKPRLKRKDIENFRKKNEEFLSRVEEITHNIKT